MRAPVSALVHRRVVHLYRHEVPSPSGPFFIFANTKGEVCCANWIEREKDALASLTDRFFKSCDLVVHREVEPREDTPGAEAARLLHAYFTFHDNAAPMPKSVFETLANQPNSGLAGKGTSSATAAAASSSATRKRPRDTEAVSVRALLDATRAQQAKMDDLLRRIPLAFGPDATPFQVRVWRTLHDHVPSGEVTTYQQLGELATEKSSPAHKGKAAPAGGSNARAIGSAMHNNPICVVVPCHRVLAANRSLNGYGAGLCRKVWLLRHEMAHDVPPEKLRRVEGETRVSTPESRV